MLVQATGSRSQAPPAARFRLIRFVISLLLLQLFFLFFLFCRRRPLFLLSVQVSAVHMAGSDAPPGKWCSCMWKRGKQGEEVRDRTADDETADSARHFLR